MKCRCIKSIYGHTPYTYHPQSDTCKIFEEGNIYDFIENDKYFESTTLCYRYRIFNGQNEHNTDSLFPNFISLEDDRENKFKYILD